MLYKSLVFFCLLSLLAANRVFAQSVSLDSTFTYITGEGTYISLGKAEGTRINIVTTTQPGLQFNSFDSASNTKSNSRLSLNLVRIAINATTFKNKVTMGIVTDFTGTTPVLEAWAGYKLNKHSKIIFGQKQTHTNNRLAMEDERYAQVMGQSVAGSSTDGIMYGGLMKNFVSTTREGGLFLETNYSLGKMRIYPSISITTGKGQNFFTAQSDLGYKYGGRLDILPFGDFIKNNAFIAHDIYRESKPKLAIGIAASINVNASSSDGSGNPNISGIYNKQAKADFANYRKLVADVMFKIRGFALVGEYISGTVTGSELFTNLTATNKLTEEVASAYYNLGSAFNVQSSFVFKSGWAIDGRYAVVSPEFNTTASLVHNQNWVTFGVNKFMKNNALKIGLNTSIINDKSGNISKQNWTTGFAVQLVL
jgi:hypothetical protein